MKEIDTFENFFDHAFDLADAVIRGLDFTQFQIAWKNYQVSHACFLGCTFSSSDQMQLIQAGAFIFSGPGDLPYQPFRKSLYTWQELVGDFPDPSPDLKIYKHFSKSRFNIGMQEALWQRMHDFAIDSSLRKLLKPKSNGDSELKCIAIMGGHSTLRTDAYYRKVALLTHRLANSGYFICSGGGPGIMEAANLGAYLSNYGADAVLDAIRMISDAASYTDSQFTQLSIKVVEKYPDLNQNLAIPTWFYGHEPSNVFATHIAKYFSNSIREDTLLAIALHGIVFAPGSAGTTQEIFMDAAQNHYGTYNYYSPMVFLGKKHYEHDTMLYPMLKKLSWSKSYADMLHVSDDIEDIAKFIEHHPPVQVRE